MVLYSTTLGHYNMNATGFTTTYDAGIDGIIILPNNVVLLPIDMI